MIAIITSVTTIMILVSVIVNGGNCHDDYGDLDHDFCDHDHDSAEHHNEPQ